MHRQTIYITYDLPRDGDTRGQPQAKSFTIQGRVVRYRIGEFKTPSGKMVMGVRVTFFLDDEEDLEKKVIVIPETARNLKVHIDVLPEEYRPALQRAA